tara:strand:- start:98 stop:721 length:624 start_codon:yes stop_codon:yes gene_type:complete
MRTELTESTSKGLAPKSNCYDWYENYFVDDPAEMNALFLTQLMLEITKQGVVKETVTYDPKTNVIRIYGGLYNPDTDMYLMVIFESTSAKVIEVSIGEYQLLVEGSAFHSKHTMSFQFDWLSFNITKLNEQEFKELIEDTLTVFRHHWKTAKVLRGLNRPFGLPKSKYLGADKNSRFDTPEGVLTDFLTQISDNAEKHDFVEVEVIR